MANGVIQHTRQPQYAAGWNPRYGKPLGLWNFRLGLRNLVDGKFATAVSLAATSQEVGPHGIGYQNDTAGGYIQLPDYSAAITASGEGTAILVYRVAPTASGSGNTPWALGTGTSPDEILWQSGASGTDGLIGSIYTDAFTTGRWVVGTSANTTFAPVGSLAVLAMQAKSGAMRLSLNGVTLASTTAAATIAFPTVAKLLGDSRATASNYQGRRAHTFLLDSRRWSDAQIDEIAANKWRQFAPLGRQSFARAVAAGGGTTVAATVGSAIGSGKAAAVALHTAIAATAGTAAAAGLAAAVALHTTIAATAGRAAAAGRAAVISAGRTIVSATAGTAAAAGCTAAVALHTVVAATAGTAAAAGRAAVVIASGTVRRGCGALMRFFLGV